LTNQKKIKNQMQKHLKVLLNLSRIDGIPLGINARCNHIRALVHVREKESGADAGLGVKPGAAIAMSTSSDLEIERAIHPVFLRPEDRRQVLRH